MELPPGRHRVIGQFTDQTKPLNGRMGEQRVERLTQWRYREIIGSVVVERESVPIMVRIAIDANAREHAIDGKLILLGALGLGFGERLIPPRLGDLFFAFDALSGIGGQFFP
ncbi:hypothetical protein DAH97_19385 [Sphingomonas koreensis]|uniref:Uncharacterized protein n=1 Tax=Sphingomonas koreensis TaxID=93064 RepID=A0A1L6JD74_9SPHN|nr:hypothetical protein BRX40_16840 [Sphingomonas koreensis]RSU49503.1 hypothetical protein CA221_13440 [Sphingomonas koreensis]RSX26616.1 hypothetical protein DAH97_19385 [Sphingomonas koreensis]RSY24880.1 hypothetical protein DAH79_17065 [Sphingomonas koreensis]RSY95961.1 hypothetical protein DAH61_17125 [Sphingomonas koreensis]